MSQFPDANRVAYERHKELMETFGKLLAALNEQNAERLDQSNSIASNVVSMEKKFSSRFDILSDRISGLKEWQLISSNCMCTVLDGAVRPCKRHYEQFNRWLLSPQNGAEEKSLTKKKSLPAVLPRKKARVRK